LGEGSDSETTMAEFLTGLLQALGSRILPHEFGSIGKESGAIAPALRRLSLENQTDKAAQLVVPLADAAFDPQKLNNERTFNGCVSSVQGEGCLKVLSLRGLRPMLCKCAPRRRSDHSDSAYP
jgi:hypothetical protein